MYKIFYYFCTMEFELKYKNNTIGYLSFKNGIWVYYYSNDFKDLNLKTLIGFPDIEKVYESKNLWQTFAVRIPSTNNPLIKDILKKENIDQNNQLEMLKRFGRKTITNPFELVILIKENI